MKRKATSRRRATARTSPLLRPIDWLSSQSTDALLFQASQLDAAAEMTKRKGGGRWNADDLGPGGSCEAGYPPKYYSYVAPSLRDGIALDDFVVFKPLCAISPRGPETS